MSTYHQPVMMKEVLEYLNPVKKETFVDNTIGGGGHALEIVKKIMPGGKLVGIDVDDMAIAAAKFHLRDFQDGVFLVKSNFSTIDAILKSLGIDSIDGALFDLGLSSAQIQDRTRGFSYMEDGKLDMRMNGSLTLSAIDIVNKYSVDELSEIFRRYGEEKFASKIADEIGQKRKSSTISTTWELSEIIKSVVPFRGGRRGHPAKRIFQALRIYINDEINSLVVGLRKSFEYLKNGGRLVVISYHSLEDRTTKNIFRELAGGCICPPDIPVCVCGRQKRAEILTKSALLPAKDEIIKNKRSKSARMRALRKIV